MQQTIRYVFKGKKIPQSIPNNVIKQTNKTDFTEHFFPLETQCSYVQATLYPEEPVLITNKAQIVGMMGIIGSKALSITIIVYVHVSV